MHVVKSQMKQKTNAAGTLACVAALLVPGLHDTFSSTGRLLYFVFVTLLLSDTFLGIIPDRIDRHRNVPPKATGRTEV